MSGKDSRYISVGSTSKNTLRGSAFDSFRKNDDGDDLELLVLVLVVLTLQIYTGGWDETLQRPPSAYVMAYEQPCFDSLVALHCFERSFNRIRGG